MSKLFFYRDININVKANEDVKVKIEYPDAGTTGHTFINIPGNNDTEVTNEGEEIIGKGSDLISAPTIITSNPSNVAAEIDKVRVNIYVNNKQIVEHNNPKPEERDPQLVVLVNFN